MYFLFEIPMYGGPPQFVKEYQFASIDKMIDEFESWT